MSQVPDLLDDAGRMRRLALSFVAAVFAAGIAYLICDQLATPETIRPGSRGGAYRFVYYVTGMVFFIAFTATLAILNARARKKRDQAPTLPSAKLR